jgi:UDP-N-acetylmuramoyl-tripeptide--D-alanyl-D-alanine ligase
MKKIIQNILGFLARQILAKYKPKVIGITGSMGKTSSKEAIYAVLSSKFEVRRNIKNYNNEIGVPLTIIGETSGLKNIMKWIMIFWRAFELLIFKKDYPEILVLEMGADRPGDIKYLTDLAPCNVGVLTMIAPVHVEFFKDIKGVIREKKMIVTHLSESNTAILNHDDINVWNVREDVDAKVIGFGSEEGSDVRAIEVTNKFEPDAGRSTEEISGTSFKFSWPGAC